MNIPLLRRIQRQIDKAPDKFAMDIVCKETNCGTAYCIAGWAKVLSGITDSEDLRWSDGAEELLGIDHHSSRALFYTGNWPNQFQAPDGTPELPALAIARIDHFIATNGEE